MHQHVVETCKRLGWRELALSNITALLLMGVVGPVDAAPPVAPEKSSSAVYEQTVRPFLRQHCYACHDATEAKAGFRVDVLETDFLAGKNADHWKEVIDRINLGEMPPKDQARPDPAQSFAVVEWVGSELKRAEREARMAGGRTIARRLNRSEYANTIRDLLHLDENFVRLIKEELPGDGKAEGFDRIGSALLFDQEQLTTYIRQAGLIAEKAIVSSEKPPVVAVERRKFENQWRPPKPVELLQDRSNVKISAGPAADSKRDGGVEFYTTVGGNKSTDFGGFGSLYGFAFPQAGAVPRDGYYRIRLRAGAFRGKRDEAIQFKIVYLPTMPMEREIILEVQGSLETPEIVETVVFLQAPPEGAKERMGFSWNGIRDVIQPHPDLAQLERARRSAGSIARLIAAKAPQKEIDAVKAAIEDAKAKTLEYSQRADAVARVINPKYKLDELPRILVDWVELEGPIEPAWPPESHTALFPQGLRDDPAQVREVFSRLLPRAYRRPVSEAEIEHIVAAVHRAREQFDMDHTAAMRYGLQTVLSSPAFLLLFEPTAADEAPRPLNDYELASRLSYFLWSSMPDNELFELARTGKLHDPLVLKGQVERMLADPRSRALAENFAGQWLHVRDYASVMPANEYQEYDDDLRDAEAKEPIAFFAELLKSDLSILNFIDSDFTMVNERLAAFYGIEKVRGEEFRRVSLPPETHRGGVLTMAGLLTYLADGSRTLPVRRGAWILEEIFNDPPPPPPPNAGEIQPNAAGARLTVRERLELHRNEPTCASCHVKIDPLGLALENYDAIGQWRTHQNGEGFNRRNAPEINAAGTLPSGRSFASPAEFKQALLAEKDRFARAFSEQMLTYALCRPVGFIDHETVEQLTQALAQNDYRLRSLILAVVTSEPFLQK